MRTSLGYIETSTVIRRPNLALHIASGLDGLTPRRKIAHALHKSMTVVALETDRWWNRLAKIADLELVIQTPDNCLIRLGTPEDEIDPELGPNLDKVCKEELKTQKAKPLASDIRHGGPLTIELENLSHGRYWVTVMERSRDAGGLDVTTMTFPQCGHIMETTGAQVSVFTHDGGRQSFDVTKDGDLYGVGRCSWDVVGIDGRTHDLHRIYPNGHNQKPKIKPDPYAKFEVDAHGNKIIQVLADARSDFATS